MSTAHPSPSWNIEKEKKRGGLPAGTLQKKKQRGGDGNERRKQTLGLGVDLQIITNNMRGGI